MPIYEYQCTACGQKLEKLQKIKDALLKDCPACHESALSKLVSVATFRLKGKGWYETDFKTGKQKNVFGERKSGSGTDDKSTSSDQSDKANSATESSSDSSASSKDESSSKDKPASSAPAAPALAS